MTMSDRIADLGTMHYWVEEPDYSKGKKEDVGLIKVCYEDGSLWPCDAGVLIDSLAASQARVRTLTETAFVTLTLGTFTTLTEETVPPLTMLTPAALTTLTLRTLTTLVELPACTARSHTRVLVFQTNWRA